MFKVETRRYPVFVLNSLIMNLINNEFNIKHRRTTQIKPVYYEKSEIRLKRDRYKRNRNIMIGVLGTSLSYRTYLYFETENIYNKYSSSIEEGDSRHKKIELLDATFRYNLNQITKIPRFDQTITPIGECAIEFVLKKIML